MKKLLLIFLIGLGTFGSYYLPWLQAEEETEEAEVTTGAEETEEESEGGVVEEADDDALEDLGGSEEGFLPVPRPR